EARAIAAIEELGGRVLFDENKAVVDVSLDHSNVTDAKELRRALPNCQIAHEPPPLTFAGLP
ncbi:MAG: hypothetical protein VB835_17705, partial [Pirellulales bacterium]